MRMLLLALQRMKGATVVAFALLSSKPLGVIYLKKKNTSDSKITAPEIMNNLSSEINYLDLYNH